MASDSELLAMAEAARIKAEADWRAMRDQSARHAAEIERLRAGIEEAMQWTDSSGECGQRLYTLLHGA